MELENLGLSAEQLQGVNDLVATEVTKTKESYKDYISKDSLKDYMANKDVETLKNDYETKLKGLTDELTNYKPQEKSEAEKALEERLAKLEQKEKEMQEKENLFKLQSKLKESKLPDGLASYLRSDVDVAKVTEIFNQHILNSSYKPDNKSSNSNYTGLTKEQFLKMDYMTQAKLYQENPELYKQLNS